MVLVVLVLAVVVVAPRCYAISVARSRSMVVTNRGSTTRYHTIWLLTCQHDISFFVTMTPVKYMEGTVYVKYMEQRKSGLYW